MSPLLCLRAWRLLQNVPANAGFPCDITAVLENRVKEKSCRL